MQMSYLYTSDFPFKNFCKLAQHAETIRKNVLEKSNDAHSLSITVQNHDKPYFDFYVFMFFFYHHFNVKEIVLLRFFCY